MKELYEYYLHSSGICTDSRQVQPGCLFFALRGRQFDGNQYALSALEQGASLAVVDDKNLPKHPKLYLVKNSLHALQQLAQYHRRQFDIPVLAVTGSNGKTTTKELVAVVLRKAYHLHHTPGNFNNHIGLPLTTLAMPQQTNFLLLEMGANHPGEIKALCHIAEPTHGLITNVGMAHLEGFGNFEGVRKTKAELYHFLQQTNGLAFVNLDEPYLQQMLPKQLQTLSYSSRTNNADCFVQALQTSPRIRLQFEKDGQQYEATLQLSGKHNFQNAMTAVAVGLYFGVSPKQVVKALESYRPQMNRSQWVEQKNRYYLLDAYNANPSSMRLALDDFAAHPDSPKIAVLGEMLELGAHAKQAHADLLKHAIEKGFYQVVCVGAGFRQMAEKEGIPWFEEVNALKNWLKNNPFPPGARILLKGSRSVALERLLQ